jgi:Flp pilus assembly protein TadD
MSQKTASKNVSAPVVHARMRAFLQGEATLADLYELSHEELYDIAAQGRRLYESGQLDSARKVFEGLTALDPCDAHFHTGLGAIYQKQGELERACVEYDRAVSLNEQDIAARCNRAEVLLQQGKLEAAAADLKRISELDPKGERGGHSLRARAMALTLGAMANQARPQQPVSR